MASIYRTRHIYISDAQYLYIQRHRYIDAKGTGCNQTCLKLHCLLWIRTSNVIILNITCSRSQHYLLSGQSFFFQVSVFPPPPRVRGSAGEKTPKHKKVGVLRFSVSPYPFFRRIAPSINLQPCTWCPVPPYPPLKGGWGEN